MPWELVVVLIATVGIFLYIKNRGIWRSTHKRTIMRDTIDHCPDATVDIEGHDEKR